MEIATSDLEEVGNRLRYQVVKMSHGSINALEMRASLTRCLSLLQPLGDGVAPEDRDALRVLERRLDLPPDSALTDAERRSVIGTCRQIVNRISARLESGASERSIMCPEKIPIKNIAMPPPKERKPGVWSLLESKLDLIKPIANPGIEAEPHVGAISLKAENKALKEKLTQADATNKAQEKLLLGATEQNMFLKYKIKRLEVQLATAPPVPTPSGPSLAVLETRLAVMEQEMARLLSQPDPPVAVSPPALGSLVEAAPAKPARRTPNEALLDRLDSRLRNEQKQAP